MATIGLSVPPGLTISTEACQEYQDNGKKIPDGLWKEILEGLDTVEKEMRASLGNPSKPLLLSVRSGAASMVFGNMGNTSGTGVLFTRNPSIGEKKLYGEFLINAQGEDVVVGIRTPEDLDTMKTCMPEAYKELVENCEILQKHYKDMMVEISILGKL